MDKKVDLDAKQETAETTVKMRPNSSSSTVVINKKVSINVPQTPKTPPTRKKRIITTNTTRSNDYDEDAQFKPLEDFEYGEEAAESEASDDETEAEGDNPLEEAVEEKLEEQKEKLKEKAKEKIKEQAKKKIKEKAKKEVTKKVTKKAAQKAMQGVIKKVGTKLIAMAGKVAATAGSASAGVSGAAGTGAGIVAGGWIVLLVIAIIILICIIIALIITIVGASRAAYETSTTKYGVNCETIVVVDADQKKYNGKVDYEEYIAGVVAAEYNIIVDYEYYKFASILARTKTQKEITNECTVSGNSTFQKYMDIKDSENKATIEEAIKMTYGVVAVKGEELITVKPVQKAKTKSLLEKGYSYEELIKEFYGQDVVITKNNVVLVGINGFVNPTSAIYCTSPFGPRIHPETGEDDFHNGLDIALPYGEEDKAIYATNDGVVVAVEKNITQINDCDYGYGNYVKIEHDDGMTTLYAHMKYGSIKSTITVGYEVQQGEQIGIMGSTGCSTGEHLHYEITKDGNRIDPVEYIDLSDLSEEQTMFCKR